MACRKNLSGLASYFLGDALGSVRQLTDAAGAVTLAKTYDPYGRLRSLAQSAGTPSTSLGFTGEVTDPAASTAQDALVYLRARYYAPGAGRFTTRDTWPGVSEQPQSLNRYAYGLDNPVMYTDPSGHCGPPCAIAIAAGVGFVAGSVYELFDQFDHGSSWNCLDWSKILLAGAIGAGIAALAVITWIIGLGLLAAMGESAFVGMGLGFFGNVGFQIGADIASGQSFSDAFSHVNWKTAIEYGVAGAIAGPITAVVTETVAGAVVGGALGGLLGGQAAAVSGAIWDSVANVSTSNNPWDALSESMTRQGIGDFFKDANDEGLLQPGKMVYDTFSGGLVGGFSQAAENFFTEPLGDEYYAISSAKDAHTILPGTLGASYHFVSDWMEQLVQAGLDRVSNNQTK